MKKIDLEAMSFDDLWSLHEQISQILSVRITSAYAIGTDAKREKKIISLVESVNANQGKSYKA